LTRSKNFYIIIKDKIMEFLDRFSLQDVATVFIGLVVVSIVRIWYDYYVNKKKATQFGSSLGIYNNLLDDTKEGLIIISDDDHVIYSNAEAADILNTKTHTIDADYLRTVSVANADKTETENLLDIIQSKNHIPNAYIMHSTEALAISISINNIQPHSHTDDTWHVVILQDMTSINELRDNARNLLDA